MDQFLGDISEWFSDTFGGGSSAPPYTVTPGQSYGRTWKDTPPPGLPAYARKAGAEGSALPDARDFAQKQGLGHTFV
jgi:hypothetical protein